MKNTMEQHLNGYIKSLKKHGFKEQRCASRQMGTNWIRIMRSWINKQDGPEYIIEERRDGTKEEPHQGELVSYLALSWSDIQCMQEASQLECPCCGSKDHTEH